MKSRGCVPVTLVPVAVFGLFATATAMPGAALAAPVHDVPPIPGGHHSVSIESVDAVSGSDVWAVGAREATRSGGWVTRPLVKHWDGTQWRTIASYDGPGQLRAVAAVSADDVWAVGDHPGEFGGGEQVMVLHWDGTEWSQATVPSYPGEQNLLTEVSFTSPTNVVVHGYYYNGEGPIYPISLVWDGSTWKAGSADVTNIISVDALSPKDAWGVGFTYGKEPGHSYAAHWNGKAWKQTTSPTGGALSSVTAIGPDDVWASGSLPGNGQGFFTHWDGTSWTFIEDPHADELDHLTGISGTASDDVWASGWAGQNGFIQHWDGHSWSDADIPFPGGIEMEILDVDAISATDAWAVGLAYTRSWPQTPHKLLIHWDGTRWSLSRDHHQAA